jgi:hypothetical protein
MVFYDNERPGRLPSNSKKKLKIGKEAHAYESYLDDPPKLILCLTYPSESSSGPYIYLLISFFFIFDSQCVYVKFQVQIL